MKKIIHSFYVKKKISFDSPAQGREKFE